MRLYQYGIVITGVDESEGVLARVGCAFKI